MWQQCVSLGAAPDGVPESAHDCPEMSQLLCHEAFALVGKATYRGSCAGLSNARIPEDE